MYLKFIRELSQIIKKNESYLNELDAINGDGEHGLNLRKSFDYIENHFDKNQLPMNLSDFLVKLGVQFLSSGGGTACTIYGAFIRRFGKEIRDKEITQNVLSVSVKSISEEIKKRGKAELGQKTMLDAIQPSVDAFSNSILTNKLEDAFQDALISAKDGLEKTKKMIGTKGRAYYAGERAKGTYDPGAMSFYLMLRATAGFIKKKEIIL